MTAAGQAALIEQKIVNERTNVILKSLLSEKIWKSTESHAAAVAGQAEREAGIWKDSTPYENKTAKLTDRIQERQTSINRPENRTKLQMLMGSQENRTKLQTVMSELENPAKRRRVMSELENRTKFQTVMSELENPEKHRRVMSELENRTKLQTVVSELETSEKRRRVMNDLGNAEKSRDFTDYPESITKFHTLMSHPENAAKFKTVTAQAENTTKFRTIMSRSESTAGSQSGVNPMSGANPMLAVASRISESGGYPSNSGYSEILPGITRFRTRRGATGTITEIRMISGIRPAVQILKTENDRSRVSQSFAGTDRLRSAQNFAGIDHLRAAQDLAGIHPLRVLHRFSDINPANSPRNMNRSDPEMIHIPDLAGAVKIQYADHGKHRQDQTASNSDVLAMSAKLTQTREETRILKRDSGFTRSTLIEQEKKINGLRQELREQMQTVNEEVKRLINTQKQDASVRNMADRVMKELQKQFRTEKIRRGY